MKRRQFIKNSGVAVAGFTLAGPLVRIPSATNGKNICIVLAGGVRNAEWLPVLQSLKTAKGYTEVTEIPAFDTVSHITALDNFFASREMDTESLIYTTAWDDAIRDMAPGTHTESISRLPGEEFLTEWVASGHSGTLYIIDHSTDAAHYSYASYLAAIENLAALAQTCITLARQNDRVGSVELVPLIGRNSYNNEISNDNGTPGGLDHHPEDAAVKTVSAFTWTRKWQGLFS